MLLKEKLFKLSSLLDNPNMTTKEAVHMLLSTQQIIMMSIQSDHPKVSAMWSLFRPMAWVLGIGVTAIIALIVSGRITIQIIP
jgi:hypothetical protein